MNFLQGNTLSSVLNNNVTTYKHISSYLYMCTGLLIGTKIASYEYIMYVAEVLHFKTKNIASINVPT